MPTYTQLRAESWWHREIITPEVEWFGSELCSRLGVSRIAYGTKGDNRHLNGGHRSQEWILRSRWCTNRTYSVEAGLTEDQSRHISAFDITPRSRDQMLMICRNLDQVVRAGHLEEVVEWFGNVDGDQRVDGFNNIRDAVASSDSSHLWHLHGRWARTVLWSQAVMQRTLDALFVGAVSTPAPVQPAMGDPDMAALLRFTESPHVFLTNGVTARWIRSEAELADCITLHREGTLPLGNSGNVRIVGRRSLLGVIVGDVPPGF